MSIPFITSRPTNADILKLKLYVSSFTDGSGYERNPDNTTRPGWRDFERIFAELFSGYTPEGKSIFDVIVPCPTRPSVKYGVSVKSKGFSEKPFAELLNIGRVYMELTNSPAKLWHPIKQQGRTERDFTNMNFANEIGNQLLRTVDSWYRDHGVLGLDINNSVHISVSYCKPKSRLSELKYIIHTYRLALPNTLHWEYRSPKCLSGYDPEFPDEVLFDWYGLSGGQLKYYPKASKAIFSSEAFEVLQAPSLSIHNKAKSLWPNLLD